MGAEVRDTFLREYIHEGRSVSLNLFFTLPLLILYEIGIQLTGSEFRNAAEVIFKDMSLLMGPWGLRFFHWFLVTLVVVFFVRAFSREQPFFRYFVLMFTESLVLALILGPLLATLVGSFFLEYPLTGDAEPDLSVRVLLSVGAGVYEEFLFRFLLLGGMFLACHQIFKAPRVFSAVLALALSALLFAAYHHLGPFGQPMVPYLFCFRLGAGLILGLVFITRGFGVAVYLHVLYDIIRDLEVALDSPQ